MAEVNISIEDVIIGRAFRDQLTNIGELTAESGLVTIQGTVQSLETRDLREGTVLLCAIVVQDTTGSVTCRCFLNYHRYKHGKVDADASTEDHRMTVMNNISRFTVGMAVTVRGECTYDTDTRELYILVRDFCVV